MLKLYYLDHPKRPNTSTVIVMAHVIGRIECTRCRLLLPMIPVSVSHATQLGYHRRTMVQSWYRLGFTAVFLQ